MIEEEKKLSRRECYRNYRRAYRAKYSEREKERSSRDYFRLKNDKEFLAKRSAQGKAHKIKLNTKFNHLKHKNKKRWNLELDFDIGTYRYILSCGCIFCESYIMDDSGIGLDRIDNSKSYFLDNVLPCCGTCNKARGTMTLVEFIRWIRTVNKRISTIGVALEGPTPALIGRIIQKSYMGSNKEQWLQNRFEELRRIQQIHIFN